MPKERPRQPRRAARPSRATPEAGFRRHMSSVAKCIAKVAFEKGAKNNAALQAFTGLGRDILKDVKSGKIELDPRMLEAIRAGEDGQMTLIRGLMRDGMMDPKKIGKASLKDLAASHTLLTKDQELLAGRPTSRDAYLHERDDSDLALELAGLEEEFRKDIRAKISRRLTDVAADAAPLLAADPVVDVEAEEPFEIPSPDA